MADEIKELFFVVGNMGGRPQKDMAGQTEVVKFSVARPVAYGKEAPLPQWWNVTVWNESLGEKLMDETTGLQKGEAVAVVGTGGPKVVNGKTYYNLNAKRVARVNFIWPDFDQNAPWPQNVKRVPEKDQAPVDDDIGF